MPPSVQAVIQQDLSKGSNLVTNPYLLGKQQAILDLNMLLDEHGSLDVRDGTLIQTSSPDVAPNIRPIIKLFDFIRQDGVIFPLAVLRGVGGGGGGNPVFNRGTSPWTAVAGFTTNEPLPDALTFTNLVIICNGYETPISWDGANPAIRLISSSGTVPAGAKHHTLHQGFYWIWNTAAASSGLDGPSSLRSSDLNNPNSWPSADQVFIDKDDGDSGQGMGQFTIAETGISPATSQILFKTFSAYQMTGVFGSTSPVFAIQKIKSDMGCVAPRTIRFAPGFGLIRLAHRGFALFDGVDDRLISEEIRPLLFGTHGFTPIDWSNANLGSAVIVPNPPLYRCDLPVQGAALTRSFVYDLVRRSWTVCQYANATSTLQAIQDPGTLPVILSGDFDHGKVRRNFADDPDDDGSPIGWEVILRPVSAPSPQQKGFYRRHIVKVTNVKAGQQITGLFVFGPTGPAQASGDTTGFVAVPPGATQITVNGNFGSSYQVKIQMVSVAPPPDWFTTKAVVAKTPTSFTVTFGTPAPAAGGLLDYTVKKPPISSPRFLTKTVTIPTTIGATTPVGLGYGQAPYGLSPYGGVIGLPVSTPEMDLTFDLGLIATNARGILSGQGRLTIRGIEWHLRSKPLTRPSVYV